MAKNFYWTGTAGTDFATAGNWNDASDGIDPSQTFLGSLDTVTFFLESGGIVSGSGTVDTLRFSPFFDMATQTQVTDIDWTVTGTLDAIGTNGISNGVTLTLAGGGVLDGTE